MYAKYAALRDEKGLNDLQVSLKTGIPASTLYDWKQRAEEKPSAGMSVENLAKIAKLLGVSVEYFLVDTEVV